MNAVRKALGLVVGLALLSVCMPVKADLIPVGDPFPGNSWGQRFVTLTGISAFDAIAVFQVSGDAFEPPTFRNFDVGSWSTIVDGSSVAAVATGTPIAVNQGVQFDLMFTTNPPIVFNFVRYLNGTPVTYSQLDYANGAWTRTVLDLSKAPALPSAAVPLPAAAWASLAMLGLLGIIRMRKAWL